MASQGTLVSLKFLFGEKIGCRRCLDHEVMALANIAWREGDKHRSLNLCQMHLRRFLEKSPGLMADLLIQVFRAWQMGVLQIVMQEGGNPDE